MFNIFLTVFFASLGFAFVDPYFFIAYLISIALFGLYQAIFMANAGGAWDNAKKIVETELKAKGTPLHDACVVGDTVGDPFKDTSSVALNPIIKFTTCLDCWPWTWRSMRKKARLVIGLALVFIPSRCSSCIARSTECGFRIKILRCQERQGGAQVGTRSWGYNVFSPLNKPAKHPATILNIDNHVRQHEKSGCGSGRPLLAPRAAEGVFQFG
jgi:hypothetical protein